MNKERKNNIAKQEDKMNIAYEMAGRFKTNRAVLNNLLETYCNIKHEITRLGDEERCAYDNLSDSAQESERGEHMDECASALEELDEWLSDIKEYLTALQLIIDDLTDEEWETIYSNLMVIINDRPDFECCYW